MNVEAVIIDLQTKYAYQEDLLQNLNEVVIGQQEELRTLKAELQRMREGLQQMTGAQQLARPDEEVPPPHY